MKKSPIESALALLSLASRTLQTPAPKLNESQRLALKYLESKRPEFVSPTEVGHEIGDHLGMDGWGSAFGLPLCNKLVSVGLAVQNDEGYYAAATK